jgi:hypothetical protein
VWVRASEKAKGASEGFVVNQSIIDRRSETETEDIMRWEGREMKKIEQRMEDLGMWAREGREVIWSG